MGVMIQDIRVICTAPEGINLVVIKVETNQPGLYGLGCGTFAYRHLQVKSLVEDLCWWAAMRRISRSSGS